MKTIFKYPLEVTDFQDVVMPVGAQILTVQVQHGEPKIWALVDDAMKSVTRTKIRTVGTGHPIEGEPGRYLGSYQLANGVYVFHVFEVTK